MIDFVYCPIVTADVFSFKLLLTTPEMRRSAERALTRNAAGKSLGDMCAAQKALATVGSSVMCFDKR